MSVALPRDQKRRKGVPPVYTFNLENFMTNASTVQYSVDAQGRQVQKTATGVTTDYFYSGAVVIAEKTGSTWTDYIFLGGQRIAKQTGDSLATATFFHADQLGSTRVCTSSSGDSAGTCDYEPFGEIQPGSTCSVPTNYRFAGMEWDADAGPNGLYYTWFRYYDPNQGRWMGVDPLAGSVGAPQSLDRYAYVVNDPANLIDPLGLTCYQSRDGQQWLCTSRGGGGGMWVIYGHWDYQWDYSGIHWDDPTLVEVWVVDGWVFIPNIGYPEPQSAGGGQRRQQPTPAEAATQFCQEKGAIKFNIPFTNIPVTISLSATALFNYSTTNDIALTLPPSAGASIDITVGAPEGPNIPVQVGFGKNNSIGTFMTPQGPRGFSWSIPVSPTIGSPVTVSPTVNACGLKAGGG
jgi:RHS repeat-associated protein